MHKAGCDRNASLERAADEQKQAEDDQDDQQNHEEHDPQEAAQDEGGSRRGFQHRLVARQLFHRVPSALPTVREIFQQVSQ